MAKKVRLAKTMTNGELYRFAWAAVRQAIENAEKWENPDAEEVRRLQTQERELAELMKVAFMAGEGEEVQADEATEQA